METDIWVHLLAQVNKYAVRTTVQNDTGSPNSGIESKWFDTMVDGSMIFISLCTNYVKKDTLQARGSTWKSAETSFFPSVISFKRYKLLCKLPHFVENAALDASDCLAKVRYPIHYVNNKFQTLYTLMQDIAIDESLMNSCERLSFIQFNPTK